MCSGELRSRQPSLAWGERRGDVETGEIRPLQSKKNLLYLSAYEDREIVATRSSLIFLLA